MRATCWPGQPIHPAPNLVLISLGPLRTTIVRVACSAYRNQVLFQDRGVNAEPPVGVPSVCILAPELLGVVEDPEQSLVSAEFENYPHYEQPQWVWTHTRG